MLRSLLNRASDKRLNRAVAHFLTASAILANWSLLCGCHSDVPPQAEDKSPNASSGVPQEFTAEEVAQRMLEKYRTATTYADSASYVQHYVVRGEGVERERPFFELAVAFERPNRLRLTQKESITGADGGQAYDIACDGESLRAAVAALPEQVLVKPAPERITADKIVPDPLLRDTPLGQSLGNVFPQLAMLLNTDDELVFPEDDPPGFLPSEDLNGRPCYRLVSNSPAGRRVLWIDQQDATLRRMELPIESQQAELNPDNAFMKHSISIDFNDPTFDAAIDDAAFALEIPDDATPVTQLTPPPPPPPPEVLARDIGDLTLYDAGMQQHRLDEYAGQVVVLDFWQIDCPPCRAQTQKLEQLRADLGDVAANEDPQIVFVGVNVDPKDAPAKLIDKTWQSWGGGFLWLADREGQRRDRLPLRATPTLAVLDRESRVQLWRPGPIEDPEELKAALTDLLDGKNLAAENRANYEARLAERRREIESHRWEPSE